MTSTNDGKDVKSNQTSGPKGKTYYIELYKSLEAGLSSDCELRERTQHLCEAWRRIHSLCQHSAPSTHPHLVSWLQRHTARIVLQTEWQSPKSKEEQKSLEEAINAFIKECENRSGSSRDAGPPPWETQLVARGEWFKKILGNPWGHPVLRVLLDPRGEPPSDEEVLEWLKEERGVMFVTRLRQLTASKCDDLALSLSSAVMERVRASAATPADTEAEQTADVKDKPKAEKKPTFEDILKNEAGFTVDVWELLIDMEFVLLHKGDKRSRCIELAKQTPLRNGYQLVERLQSRLETSPREKKLWKNAKEVATLIAQVVITRCMVVPICSGAPRTALYCCARSLVRALGPRLPPAARALAAPAATARHLHTLAAAVDAQSKDDMKPFVCELYVRAITAGMNELERLKLKTEKEADARSAEQTLASWFTQLGALLSASERIRCECTLTAFSVHPTPAMYERIKAAPALPPLILDDQETKEEPNKEFGSWASDSRGQTNFVKTSETLNLKHTQHQANVLSTAIFSEGEVLGISPELCTDIAVLLSGPRLKTLSWDTDRELLLENCRTYMERTNFGTRALTTELKYLNLDPREFQHLPEEEDDDTDKYYGIEKGYEHLVEEYQEPEEIWQDAEDPERTESAHSSDIESETPMKAKKAQRKIKKIHSSEDDSDPLSLVAEAKRVEKKKERPHSKERSKDGKERSKEPKKSKSKAKPKDPLEMKDQSTEKKKEPKKKKERKKKEKLMPVTTTCTLSNLIGMRVTNAMKKPVPCVVNTPSVSDSDYDNQGKSSNSILSENNETNVLFDGLFSMDELKSPEKSPDMKTLTKNSELHIANGTVGVSTSVVHHNERQSRNEASKHKVPNSPQSRTGSPSNMMVKESLSKLLQYRRQKAIEMEQRMNLQPNVVHTYSYKQGAEYPTITPAPSPVPVTPEASPKPQLTVNVPENPKVYINKTQSEQLSELRNEVNNLLSAKTFGIARPVIQYGPKAKNCLLNNTQISGSRFPSPSLQKSMQNMYKIPQMQEKPTTVGSTESKATPSRSNVPNKQISVDSASPQNFHIFLKELQESINAGAGAHSSKNVNMKKEIKPTSRVTPVVPKTKAEPKTSPQCAKQSQKKTSDFLNTFSRLSYLHKNKVDPKIGTKPVVDALIEYQSKTLQNPPTDAEINRILMEQKLAAKSLQLKNEPATPKSDRAAYQHPENSQSILKKFDKPKHVSNSVKQNPIIANILSSQTAKPVKPENQYRNVQMERSRETSTTPNKFSSLTERDQQDLLALLRQQTKLNLRPTVEHVKEKVQPPQTITNYSIPCTSQSSNKHKIVEAPTITYNNVNIKQVTKPSPSIKPSKPSNVNLDLRMPQTKPLNMVKTEINCTKTVDPKPTKKIEILSNIEIKSSIKPKPETLAEPKEETDWEKVMDAILSHKTPSRGPKALDMALNKDAYNKALAESLRNQRIVKANSTGDLIKMTNVISKGQSKPALTADPKLSPHPTVLSRSNTESVIKTIKKYSKTPAKVVQKPSTNTSVLQVNPNVISPVQPETPKRQIQTEKRLSYGTKDQIDILKLPVKHQEKQFTAPYYKEEDPFISGIPNSDYEILEALMDDDLRQEIGELSSDEDNYTAPMQSLKGKNYSINKPIIPAIQEDNCLNPIVINTAPAHKKPVPKVRSDIPKTAFDSSVQKQHTSAFVNVKSMVKTAEYIHNEAKNIQTTIAVHQMPQSVITPSKNRRNQSYHASTDQLRTEDQTNTFVAAVPRQTALKNVVLIGSDIVYQPSTVQTPVNVTQNTYVKYNNQQNMALYQTTQFAAPVVNPVIIGNAITMSKTTTPMTAPLTTVANKPKIVVQTPKSKEEKINDAVQNKTVIHDTKVAKSEPKTNPVDNPNDDTAKSEKEKVDINSNKNVCERKVLSEVQEKQKLEKVEPKNTRSQTRKSFERTMNDVIKDQERLQKKRLSIMNRNITHRIDKKAIPLSYAPLKSLKMIIRVPKAAQKKYEKVKSPSDTKNDSKIQSVTVKSIKAKTTEVPVEAKVIAKLDKPDKTIKTESYKENKDKPSCRRILLRSSSKDLKLDTQVAEEVSVPRKTKVRLKHTPTECENKTLENCTGGDSINKLKVAKKPVTKKTLNKTIKKVEGKKKATKIQPKRTVKVINRKSEPKPQEVIPNEMTDLMDIEDEIITSKILEVMSPDQPIPPLQEIPNIEEILGDIEENRTLDDSVVNCPSPSILENDFTLNQLIETESDDKPIDDSTVVTQENANNNNEVVNKEDDTTTETIETVVEPIRKDTNKNMTNTDIVKEIESYVKKLEDRIKDTAVNQRLELECNEIMFSSKDVSPTSEQSSQPDRQTSEIIAPVKQNTSNPNINNDKAKHQENTVHIEEDIICIDEDDEEPGYIIPPSKVLMKDGKINSAEKRKNGMKDDLPQSYMDAILIKELPQNTGDPLKKNVRIQLPCGKVFKATVTGQMNMDTNSLFSDPALKSIILNNVYKRTRYTLNIKQISTTSMCKSEKVLESRIHEIRLNGNDQRPGVVVETIDLLSDSDEETQQQSFNTEYGKYQVQRMEKNLLENHQKLFDKKCVVKLKRKDLQKYLDISGDEDETQTSVETWLMNEGLPNVSLQTDEPTKNIEPAVEFSVQPITEPVVEPVTQDAETVIQSGVQPMIHPEVQPVIQSAVQSFTQTDEQSIIQSQDQNIIQRDVQLDEHQEFDVQPITKLDVQPINQPDEQPVISPDDLPVFESVIKSAVQPIIQTDVQFIIQSEDQPLIPPDVQPITEPDVQSNVQPLNHSDEQSTDDQPVIEPIIQSEVQPAVQTEIQFDKQTVIQPVILSDDVPQPDVQPIVQPDVQPITQPDVQPDVQPIVQPDVQPITQPDVQPMIKPDVQPITQPDVQPIVQPDVQPITQPDVQPITRPDVQSMIKPHVQPITQPDVQPITQPDVQPMIKPDVQPITQPDIQPITQPDVQPITQPDVQPMIKPDVQPITQPDVRPIIEPDITSVMQSDIPTILSDVEPVAEQAVVTIAQPGVQAIDQVASESPLTKPTQQEPVEIIEIDDSSNDDDDNSDEENTIIGLVPFLDLDESTLKDKTAELFIPVQKNNPVPVEAKINEFRHLLFRDLGIEDLAENSTQSDDLFLSFAGAPLVTDSGNSVSNDFSPQIPTLPNCLVKLTRCDELVRKYENLKLLKKCFIKLVRCDELVRSHAEKANEQDAEQSDDIIDIEIQDNMFEDTAMDIVPLSRCGSFSILDNCDLFDTQSIGQIDRSNSPVMEAYEAIASLCNRKVKETVEKVTTYERSTCETEWLLTKPKIHLQHKSSSIEDHRSIERCNAASDSLTLNQNNVLPLKALVLKLFHNHSILDQMNSARLKSKHNIRRLTPNRKRKSLETIVTDSKIAKNCDDLNQKQSEDANKHFETGGINVMATELLDNTRKDSEIEHDKTMEASSFENSIIEVDSRTSCLDGSEDEISASILHKADLMQIEFYVNNETPQFQIDGVFEATELDTELTDEDSIPEIENIRHDAREINVATDTELTHEVGKLDAEEISKEGSEGVSINTDVTPELTKATENTNKNETLPEIVNITEDILTHEVTPPDTESILETEKYDEKERDNGNAVLKETEVALEKSFRTDTHIKSTEMVMEGIWGDAKTELKEMETTLLNTCDEAETKQDEIEPVMEGICDDAHKKLADPQMPTENVCEDDGCKLVDTGMKADKNMEDPAIVTDKISGDTNTRLVEPEMLTEMVCEDTDAILIDTGIADTKPDDPEIIMEDNICSNVDTTMAEAEIVTEDICEDAGSKQVDTEMESYKKLDEPKIVIEDISGNTTLAEPETASENICEDIDVIFVNTAIEKQTDIEPDDPVIIIKDICNNADTTIAEPEMATEIIRENTDYTGIEKEPVIKLDESEMVREGICGATDSKFAEQEMPMKNVCVEADIEIETTEIEKEVDTNLEESEIVVEGICGDTGVKLAELEMPTENVCKDDTNMEMADIVNKADSNLEGPEIVKDICNYADTMAEPDKATEKICEHTDTILVDTELENEADKKPNEQEMVMEGICADTDKKISESEMPTKNICEDSVTEIGTTEIEKEVHTKLEEPEIMKDTCKSADTIAEPEKATEKICEYTDAILLENDYAKPNEQEIVMDGICGDADTKLAESEMPAENAWENTDTELDTTEIEVDTNLEESEIIVEDISKDADTRLAESEMTKENLWEDTELETTEIEDETSQEELEIVMEGSCGGADAKLAKSEMPTENFWVDAELEPTVIQTDTNLKEPEMVMKDIFSNAGTKSTEPEMLMENVCEDAVTEIETIEIDSDSCLEEPEMSPENICEDTDAVLVDIETEKEVDAKTDEPEMPKENVCEDAYTEIETTEIEDETSQEEPEMVMEGSCGDADAKLAKPEMPTENVWVDPELEPTVIQTDTNLKEPEMVMKDIFSNADTKSTEPEMLMENVCEDAVTEIETIEIDSDSRLEEPEMSPENICEDTDAVLVDIETEKEVDAKTDEPEMPKENVCEDANTEIETTEIEKEVDTTMAEPGIAIENICEDTDPILVDTETEKESETTLDETEVVMERTTLAESKMLMENVCADADTETTEIVNELDISQEEPEIVMEVICQYADEELLLPVIKQTDKKLEEPEIETDTSFEEPEMVVEVICQYADEKLVLPVIDAETKLKEPEAAMDQLERPEMTLHNISENTKTKQVYSETEIETQIEGSEIISKDITNNNDTILKEPEMALESNSEDADIAQATEIEQEDEPNLEEPKEVVEDICKNVDRKLEEAELEKETDTKLEQPEMLIRDICNNANTKLSGTEMATESMDKKFKQIELTLQMMFADTNSMLEETEMSIENASKEPDTKQDETNIVLANKYQDAKTGTDVEIKCAELGENMVENADKNPAQSDLVRDNSSFGQSTIIVNGAKKNNIVIDFDITVICEEVDETISKGEDNIPEEEFEHNTTAETSVITTDDNDIYLNRSKENQTVLNNVKLINNDHKPQEVSIECKDEPRFYVSEIDDNYLVEEVVEMRSDEILDDEMAQVVLASDISQVNEVSKHDPVSHIENEELKEPETPEIVHVQNQDTNLKLLENNVLCSEHYGSLLMNCEDYKSPEENILITQQIGKDGQIEEIDIKLNVPRRTYSKKYPHGLIFNCLLGDMKNRKRKIDMTDVKIYEKRYRKGKHIDSPIINVTTMGETGYGKEFKQLLDYCSTVKFSYSRPFHKEYIDVQEILQSWPIKGICNVEQSETAKDETLFTDMEKEGNTIHDPSIQTLAEEIDSNDNESNYKSCDVIETNFNMGFGERSGRVIQNLEDGCGTKFSAATLSDVKQTQPLLLSENYGNCKRVRNTINFTNKHEIEKLHSNIKCIQMKDKVRSFFKKSMNELSYDWIKQQGKDDMLYSDGLFDSSDFPYGLTDPDFIQPQFEAIVQVVQVGQLPVSAAAQNPVTCDPRVTQVSNVSPSQCSAENSPGDDQSLMKTEYTELTTADLSIPLAQEYVQHIQSMPMPPHGHEIMNYPMGSNYTVDLDIKPEIKIEMEETSEIKEEINDNYENSEYPPLFEKNIMNSVDYSHITPLEPNSNVTMMYNYTDKQSVPEAYPHLKQQEHLQMQQQLHQQQQQQEHYQQQQQEQYEQQQKLIQQQLDQEQQQLQQQQEFQQRQIELQQLQLEQQQQKLQEIQQLQLKQQQEEQKQQQLRLQELKQQQELKEQQEQQEEMQKHQQHLLELKRAQDLKQQQQQQQQELKQQKQELKQQQQRQKQLKQQQQLELKQQKRLELKQKQQKQQELKQQQQKQQELKQQQLAQLKQQKQQQQQQLKQQKQQQLQQKQQLKQQKELQQKQQLQQQQELQQKQQLQQQQELQQKQQLQQQQELQQKQQLQQQQELQQKQQLQQQQELQQKQQLQQQQELQQKQQLQQQQELQQKKQLQQQQELQQKQQLQQQQELQQKQQQQELQQKQQMQQQQELQQKQLMQQQQQEMQQKQQIQQQQQQQEQQQLLQQQQQQQQEQQQLLQQQQQQQHNSSLDKTDQIAHAMNAAGISPSADALSNNRAQAIVNMISQKLRQGGVSTGQSSNNFQKTTSINAMALQQALAQILPPPLNQTNASENNQQISNTHTPQVLHIVQGKSSSGNHQQITLVENTQQSVINAPNSTPLLHIVQNKTVPPGPTSNGTPTQQTNSFSGLSLVDGGLQQGNQLLHIVNAGHQKNANTGQLLKRVNLLTNLTNAQGGNEQKMVQFVCKSADGKAIQLNGPHQRSMVLRLQPVETPNLQQTQPKQIDSQDLSPTHNAANNKDAEIKSRSIYEENYAKFIQGSSPKTPGSEKGTSLPKFNQAFGKQVYQDDGQKNEISNGNALSPNDDNPDCQANDNAMSLEHISQIGSPPLLLRKPATSQAQPNLVQQLKQTISPMNLHGGVIYTRQIPVNLAGGQTINLITVPSSDLVDESNQKQQGEIEPSIIKIVPQNQTHSNSDGTEENNTHTMGTANDNAHTPQPQPVLTQMRIKLPMLSKAPQMMSGGRVVRPSFFQIQRNVISGTNQPVYQQLVLTAAPQLGQQTIRLPQAQTTQTTTTTTSTTTSRPAAVKATPSESQSSTESMSSSTLEQLREFDLVLEQVKERSTVQPKSKSRRKKEKAAEASASTSAASAEPSRSTPAPHKQHQVLYSIGNTQPLNVAYVNRKAATPAPASTSTPTTSTFVRSPDSSGIVDSSPSSSSQIPHTVTSEPSTSSDAPAQSKSKSSSKSKSRPKASSNPPNTLKLNTAPPKPSAQKPAEDEQTTQRILYILAEYKEQVENSPDKDKPAPRRRTNPPSNPGSSKRKRSRRNRDLSPTDDSCRTMGSEDSSCGTSQGDCNESCIDSHSPQDSPRKVVRKLTFEHDTSAQSAPHTPQPRPQPQQRNVIVSDGQTITVARGTAGKPSTAVLMPANYILPVSMIKGGQQIAIVTNRGPKLLTVGGGEGGATNALLLQRLIGPPGTKPLLTRPGVRHVRLPAAALHNLQAFNLATATTIQPPDSTASPAPGPTPPELIETRANSSPWRTEGREEAKPERGSSPEGEPWHLPATANPHDYSYEEVVRTDNMDRTVLDPIPDRYSPDMEAQRIFDKMFDVDSKRSYMVGSHDDSPRCGYDIDASDCDDKGYHQVVQKKDGSHHRQHRLTHVSAAALRHKYAILEHELRLQEYLSQKSLSEECEDLGVDSPSASELFPEAELLFAASPAHDHTQDHGHHSHTPQPLLHHSSIPQPDLDDQIATDQLLPRSGMHDDRSDLGIGLEDVGIVTVSEDGMQATIALDQEEFARSHPNTTFHSEPTDEGEVQPFTISGLKGRHISTIFHANRAPGTVLMTAPQTTVISQATGEGSGVHNTVKYADIDNMINSLPGPHTHSNINLSSVLVKDDGLTRFDSILNDNRELHLSNTASHIVHATGNNTTQVIRRVCYGNKREQASRFLIEESDNIMARHHAKMMEDSRGFGDVDDDGSSPERTELFWESNSASERDIRRPLDFSSDSDKCCKSPSFEENNSTDSSGLGAHMRLDSVIKDARGIERRVSADGSSADDNHAPPLRTYPPKRMYQALDAQRSLTGKTRAPDVPERQHAPERHDVRDVRDVPMRHHVPERQEHVEGRRRASGRGVVKRGCHCCNGDPAPPRPKKPRQRKPNIDFITN